VKIEKDSEPARVPVQHVQVHRAPRKGGHQKSKKKKGEHLISNGAIINNQHQ